MSESITMSVVLPVKPERLYKAWLDSKEHAGFTGAGAEVDPNVGGAFQAWDDYISGTNLELQPFARIVQAWRTTEFADSDPDSRLEVLLKPQADGSSTELVLLHTDIPDGTSEDYRQGWIDYYFEPMKVYFSK